MTMEIMYPELLHVEAGLAWDLKEIATIIPQHYIRYYIHVLFYDVIYKCSDAIYIVTQQRKWVIECHVSSVGCLEPVTKAQPPGSSAAPPPWFHSIHPTTDCQMPGRWPSK